MGGENFEATAFSGADLACRRGGRLVFSGLTFSLSSGGALVLRGANGSGKTTLLRLMAGLTRQNRGGLSWGGTPIEDADAHAARLRFVGHLDAIKPAFTVAENLNFWATMWAGRESAATLHAAMAAFDLERLAAFPARHLSAGQRHRLALARLLVAPAPLWLLDEPGNALDDKALVALAQAIANHRARGGMAVVTSHGPAPVSDHAVLDLSMFTPIDDPHWSDAA